MYTLLGHAADSPGCGDTNVHLAEQNPALEALYFEDFSLFSFLTQG
jgi:hypothetical protein